MLQKKNILSSESFQKGLQSLEWWIATLYDFSCNFLSIYFIYFFSHKSKNLSYTT